MKEIGNKDRQEVSRHKNNKAENSHLPFRRRERAMSRFLRMSYLQSIVSIHASLHNHFNLYRHINRGQTFKVNRDEASLQWRDLLAA
jgi:putative transposase